MMFLSVVFGTTVLLRLSHDCVIVFSDGMYCLRILFSNCLVKLCMVGSDCNSSIGVAILKSSFTILVLVLF